MRRNGSRRFTVMGVWALAGASIVALPGCQRWAAMEHDGGVHKRRGWIPDAPSQAAAVPFSSDDDGASSPPPAPEQTPDAEPADEPAAQDDDDASAADTLPEGLIIDTLREGEGAVCRADSLVTLRYQGRVLGGSIFDRVPPDASRGPWPVEGLIPGLRHGLLGMREGGRRRVTIPPELAYADEPVVDAQTGETVIPAGSTLVFTVELLEVRGPESSATPREEVETDG